MCNCFRQASDGRIETRTAPGTVEARDISIATFERRGRTGQGRPEKIEVSITKIEISATKIEISTTMTEISDTRILRKPRTGVVRRWAMGISRSAREIEARPPEVGAWVAHIEARAPQIRPRVAVIEVRMAVIHTRPAVVGPRLAQIGPRLAHIGRRPASIGPGLAQIEPRPVQIGSCRGLDSNSRHGQIGSGGGSSE